MPTFRLDRRNIDDVATLVRALDGLPLALELAAARIRMLSPAKMLARMDRRFDLLKSRRRDVDPRQATLHNALAWSWELLAPWEQAALAHVSTFEGGFSLDAAEAVVDLSGWPDAPFVVDVLQSLIDKSLLRRWQAQAGGRSLETWRYGMLVSVQAFAAERLRDMTAQEHINARHAAFFTRLGDLDHQLSLHRWGGEQRQALDLLEVDNLLVAIKRAIAAREGERAAAVLLASFDALSRSARFAEGVALATAVLEDVSVTPLTRGRVLIVRGRWQRDQSAWDTARADLHKGLTLMGDDDPHLTFAGFNTLAVVEIHQGHIDAAQQFFARACEVAARANVPQWSMIGLGGLAIIDYQRGHLDRAAAKFETILEKARAWGDRRSQRIVLSYLEIIRNRQGRLDEARAIMRDAWRLAATDNDRSRASILLSERARFERQQGQYNEARQMSARALTLATQLGQRIAQAVALHQCAVLEAELGDHRRALEHYRAELAIVRELKDTRREVRVHLEMADSYEALDQCSDANTAFEQAAAQVTTLDAKILLADVLVRRAHFALRRGRQATAQQDTVEAQSLMTVLKLPPDVPLVQSVEALERALARATCVRMTDHPASIS